MRHARCGAICASVTAFGLVVNELPADDEHCVDLVAERTLVVGRVCVTERSDTLFVRFEAEGNWRLTETHLAVSSDLEGIPLAGGRQPILGRFPYKDAHVPGVAAFAIAIPTKDRPGISGTTLIVAAHASVVRDGAEEGAWAKGSVFAPEGNPATYFLYRRSGAGRLGLSVGDFTRQFADERAETAR